MKPGRLVPLLIAVALGVAAVVLAADQDQLRLPTLSSGGGRSVSGGLTLVGSVGQPIAGRLSSGSTQLCTSYPGCYPPPSISVADASIVEGDTGTTALIFDVTLSHPTVARVTVGYTTKDGTATAGSDYVAASGTLTVTPGVTATTVSVSVLGDILAEGDEAFTLALSAPTNAALGDGEATGTILDDEGAPTISVSDASVAEGNAGSTAMVFAVTLSHPTVATVTVGYATSDGTATAVSDYLATSGTLTVTPGVTVTTVLVPVVGDVLAEGDEAFALALSDPTNATLGDGEATGTIQDDDGGYRVYVPLVMR
jgi:chitinase